MLRHNVFRVPACAFCIFMGFVSVASAFPGQDEAFPYVAIRTTVAEALEALSDAVDVPIDATSVRRARVSERVSGETAGAFLDALAERANLDWYYDGQTIHVSPVAQRRTLVLPLDGRRPDAVVARLQNLGVYDTRFPFRGDGAGGVAMLVAPPRYADLVEQLFPEIPSASPPPPTEQPSTAEVNAPPSRPAGVTVQIIRAGSRDVQTVPR